MFWFVVFVVLALLAWDRLDLWARIKNLPGPKFSIPFIGQTIQMVMNPVPFYDFQETYGDLSWNSAGGKFILFSKATRLSRNVFNNAKGSLRLWLIFGAEKILGKDNIAFLHGPKHQALRRSLLPLFTKRAMATYLKIQEAKIKAHLDKWVENTKDGAKPIRVGARDINIDTSLEVFIGPYMSMDDRPAFTELYFKINEGMLAFPIALPGTTLWKAVKAREKLIVYLEKAVVGSKERMQKGEQPSCLLDYWMEDYIKDADPPLKTNEELAYTVLDFLFASQDASTSSITWAVQLVADHPEVLKKVREEQSKVRPNNEPLTYELLSQMHYTHQVVKEILRFRPPATMVPHIAIEDWNIEDEEGSYTVKKGSVILPSIWCASFEGYTDPYTFDPERFNEERAEHIKNSKSWLVFGAGSHLCLGKEYAMNHLSAFVAVLATNYEFEHIRTSKSDTLVLLPTICPADDCILKIEKRPAVLAN